jgi:phenylacetate-CoA ligase
VQAETVLVEVLDDAGRACAAGETGRVVLTSLHNFAMPLIRYAIQDYAEVGAPCPCGRGLPVLTRILGRSRNRLSLPDGRRVWPLFSPKRYLRIAPIRQLQIVQHAVRDVEVRYVTDHPLSDAQLHDFEDYLRSRLEFPLPLRMRRVDAVPRAPNGKFEDFVSHVE